MITRAFIAPALLLAAFSLTSHAETIERPVPCSYAEEVQEYLYGIFGYDYLPTKESVEPMTKAGVIYKLFYVYAHGLRTVDKLSADLDTANTNADKKGAERAAEAIAIVDPLAAVLRGQISKILASNAAQEILRASNFPPNITDLEGFVRREDYKKLASEGIDFQIVKIAIVCE